MSTENKKLFEKEYSLKETINKTREYYKDIYSKDVSDQTLFFLINLFLLYIKTKKGDITRFKSDFDVKDNEINELLSEKTEHKFFGSESTYSNDNGHEKDKLEQKGQKTDKSLYKDVVENIIKENLSKNGYIKSPYKKEELEQYYEKVGLKDIKCDDLKKWKEIQDKNKENAGYDILLSLNESYKIELREVILELISKTKPDKSEEFKMLLNNIKKRENLESALVYVKNIVEDSHRVKNWEEKIKEYLESKQLNSDLTIHCLNNNDLLGEVYTALKSENTKKNKEIKKVRKTKKYIYICTLIFALLFVSTSIFFDVFQGLGIWNEELSRNVLIYIGFSLLGLLSVSFIVLVVFILLNKKDIQSYGIGGEIQYKDKLNFHEDVIKSKEIIEEILYAISKEKNHHILITIKIIDFKREELNKEFLISMRNFTSSIYDALRIFSKEFDNRKVYFKFIFDITEEIKITEITDYLSKIGDQTKIFSETFSFEVPKEAIKKIKINNFRNKKSK